MTCIVEGCGRPRSARGLCTAHYQRMWRRGGLGLPVRYPDARNKAIIAARRAGSTLAAIGKMHGITRERVRQIVEREERRRPEISGREPQQERDEMFVIDMPVTFKIGDTIDCRINDEPSRVTWRDAKTLVIEPDDARGILECVTDGKMLTFCCGNAVDEPQGPFTIIRPGVA